LIDLAGAMVLPGLMDSHTHPLGAALTEFDHEIPAMESIADVLAYIRARAKAVPEGGWIVLQQVFITACGNSGIPRARNSTPRAEASGDFSHRPGRLIKQLGLKLSGIDRISKFPKALPAASRRTRRVSRPASCGTSAKYVRRVRTTTRPRPTPARKPSG